MTPSKAGTHVLMALILLLLPVAGALPGDADLEDATGNGAGLADLAAPAREAGAALAAGAGAVADGVAGAAQALGGGLAALGAGIAALAGALAHGLVAAFVAVGGALAALAGAIGALLHALGALLGALGLAGARTVAAHPKESALVAGSATGAAGIAWLARRLWGLLFVPLYTRLAPSEMLDNKVRSAVYEHVRAHPGAHPSAIAAAVGIGWGTVVYHLARLEESKLVTARFAHHRKCYFVVGGELDAAGREAVAAIQTDKAKAIVQALRDEPGLSQKDLADRLGMSQALASWHVKRLVACGVLLSARSGRSNLLHVAQHVPREPAALAA